MPLRNVCPTKAIMPRAHLLSHSGFIMGQRPAKCDGGTFCEAEVENSTITEATNVYPHDIICCNPGRTPIEHAVEKWEMIQHAAAQIRLRRDADTRDRAQQIAHLTERAST